MIKILDNEDDAIARQIVKLQKEAYIVEAELIGFDEIPPLKETPLNIKESDEKFIGYFEEEELAGILAYKLEEGTLDIYRVAVLPRYFRKGIAKNLINYALQNNTAKRIIVSTGMLNKPAIKLYLSMGFNKVKDIKVLEDLYITSFEKIINS